MDYRQRRYYLINVGYYDYHTKIKILKKLVPSIKFHSPYNHFNMSIKTFTKKDVYDGEFYNNTKIHYVQYMISCKTNDVVNFEQCMKQFVDRYWDGCIKYVELNKEMCRQ